MRGVDRGRARSAVLWIGLAGLLLITHPPVAGAQGGGGSGSTNPQTTHVPPIATQPGYLVPTQEPTFHGRLTRIAGDVATPYSPCPAPSCRWGVQVRPTYSKVQPWNSTGTLLAIDNNGAKGMGFGPSHLLLDGSNYRVLDYPKYPYPGFGDFRWHPDVSAPYVQINVSDDGTELAWFDVRTGETVPRHRWLFAPGAVQGIGMSEGNPSNDGRYIALGRTTEVTADRFVTHVFAVDMLQGRVGDTTWTLPDCDLAPDGNCKAGWFSISPDGRFLVVKYASQGDAGNENRDCIRVFDFHTNDLTFTPHAMTQDVACGQRRDGSPLDKADGWVAPLKHADMTILGGGQAVLVGINSCPNSANRLGRIHRIDLSTGKSVTLSPPDSGSNPPRWFTEAAAMHVSCRNLDRPGWCYVSYDRSENKRFDDEIVALSTDGLGAVERFAHQHSFVADPALSEVEQYKAEPHAVPSRDGHRVVWGSNWCWPEIGQACADPADVKTYVIDDGDLDQCPNLDTWSAAGWQAENSLLERSASYRLALDNYRLKSAPALVDGRYRLRIYGAGNDVTTLDQVRLAYVDHPADLDAFALDGSVVLGRRTPAFRVTKFAGGDITALVSGVGKGYFVGQPGDTLLVELISSDPAVVPASSGSTSGSTDAVQMEFGGWKDGEAWTLRGGDDDKVLRSTGVLIQARQSSGAWTTVRRMQPRRDFDDFLVDAWGRGPLRIVFVGRHRLRYVGRVTPAGNAAIAKELETKSANHSRLGYVRPALRYVDGGTVTLAPGDTLALAFVAPPTAAGVVRDLFLVSTGEYHFQTPGALDAAHAAPSGFDLIQNRPNPFTRGTTILFDLPAGGPARLEVFDAQGRRVATLANHYFLAGRHAITWDRTSTAGPSVPPGVYLYRLIAGSLREQRQMVLTR